MSSHICLRIHFIWSTTKRTPLIAPDWEPRLFAYLGTVLADRRGVLLAANGTPDHIHLYTSLPSTLSLAEITNALKANSSRWIHETLHLPDFAWQKGYGAFSVSPSADHAIRTYIQNQKEHHRARTFQEEYLDFLKRHQIDYDPPHDTWGDDAWESCTKGKITVTATAVLYEKIDANFAKKFADNFDSMPTDSPSGGLPVSYNDPGFGNGAASMSRSLTATWDCTGGEDNKTRITIG
ncbi:MAG TPA: IS200/IS605 family transposase [Phycisphaerae bacterium]|nr:IS200/IS605 family transposase [Phycisphaerae bacterium]